MAANDVFVDTAGFLALWDAADAHHDRALRLQSDLARKRRPITRILTNLSRSGESLKPVPPCLRRGATHLFEQPGALERVAAMAAEWFALHFKAV